MIFIKICGYYLLIFLFTRLYGSLKGAEKRHGKDEKIKIWVAMFIIYAPSMAFVIYQLFALGFRL